MINIFCVINIFQTPLAALITTAWRRPDASDFPKRGCKGTNKWAKNQNFFKFFQMKVLSNIVQRDNFFLIPAKFFEENVYLCTRI